MILCVNRGKKEIVVKKSRFIAISETIDDRGQVKDVIALLKEKYRDATHVCYAYIADESGDDFGYDDDGEPSGTAGKPIYSALNSVGARKSLIVVVRYFGGVKLGAGGLVRAYRQSASELIADVGLAQAERRAVYEMECDGETYKIVSQILRNKLCKTEQIRYNKNVGFTAICPIELNVAELLMPLGVTPKKTCERLFLRQGD